MPVLRAALATTYFFTGGEKKMLSGKTSRLHYSIIKFTPNIILGKMHRTALPTSDEEADCMESGQGQQQGLGLGQEQGQGASPSNAVSEAAESESFSGQSNAAIVETRARQPERGEEGHQLQEAVGADNDFRRCLRILYDQLGLKGVLFIMYISCAMASVIVEMKTYCDPSLKIWLIIMSCYLIIRSGVERGVRSLRAAIERVELANADGQEGLGHTRCNLGMYTVSIKFMELLDVFGVITYCVGNLMIIKSQSCYKVTPISSYCSLTLVLLTNACLLLPFIRKLFILCSYNSNGLDAEMIVLRGRQPSANLPQNDEELRNFMSAWLQSYGAYAKPFVDMPVSGEAAVGISMASCPICLQAFESAEKVCDPSSLEYVEAVSVVPFPCTALHLFHSDCLISWLTVTARRGAQLTCPCCREEASLSKLDQFPPRVEEVDQSQRTAPRTSSIAVVLVEDEEDVRSEEQEVA